MPKAKPILTEYKNQIPKAKGVDNGIAQNTKTDKTTISNTDITHLEYRKTMLTTETLLRTNQVVQGTSLLKRLLLLSHDLELFNERAMLYNLVDEFNISLNGKEAKKKYRDEIHTIIDFQQQSLQLCDTIIQHHNSSINNVVNTGKFNLIIKKLKLNYESTGSYRLGYFYHFASICLCQMEQNHKCAVFHGEQLLLLAQTNTRIFTSTQKSNALRLMATSYLHLNEYTQAINRANESVKLATDNSKIQAQSLETVFFALLRSKQLTVLNDVVAKAKSNKLIIQNKVSAGKWQFFKAVVHFRNKEFNTVLQELKDCTIFPREEQEWIIYSALLDAMTRFELGQHEWFAIRSEALRKCIYRYENKNRNKRNGRINLIFILLKELHRHKGDFNAVLEKENSAIELLQSSEGNYYWNPTGPEAVRFEEWLFSKARNQGINRKGKKTLVA